MILRLMAYVIAVGFALGATGTMLDRVLALRRLPRRGVWAALLAANLLLVIAVPWRAPHTAAPPTSTAHSSLLGVTAGAGAPVEHNRWVDRGRQAIGRIDIERVAAPMNPFLAVAGVISSAGAAAMYAVALWTLSRRRRTWRGARLRGTQILVAPTDGPGVVGVWAPRIVLPEWTLSLAPDAIDLMLAHEREHQRSRDPLLVHAAALGAIAMPWNPAAWWMLARLKLAVEMDCDARVLGRTAVAGDDKLAYGELLLTVAVRQSPQRSLIAPAMLEHPSSLRRRIAAMYPIQRGYAGVRLVTAGGTALALLTIALVLPAPSVRAQAGSNAKDVPPPAASEEVYEIGNGVRSPVPIRSLDPSYTKAAMDAKIQGEVHLSGVVEPSGVLDQVHVIKSLDTVYGLDQSAIDAAKKWLFKPGTKDGKPVPVRVQLILEFRLRPGQSASPAPDANRVYETGADIVSPVPIRQLDPGYTKAAMDARIQGEVHLSGVVGTNGLLGNIQITKSLDAVYGLDQAAVDTAKRWMFKPGTKDGRAVPVRVELTFEFKLR